MWTINKVFLTVPCDKEQAGQLKTRRPKAMSEQPTPHSIRTSLVREYWNASLLAGIVGTLITLGGLAVMHVLAKRGVVVFDNVLILGTVLCGFLVNAAILKIFVNRRLIGPFAKMLRDLNFYLTNKGTSRAIDITTDDELGAVARRCEDLMQEIISQQNQLEDVNERFQAMIARLSEAKETAEQADLAKTQFMARMSHEIRTPINGVLGMIELLLDSELTESQARLARIIRDSGKTLLGIIDGLLDFAKLEVDKLILETTSFDLRKLTEDVVSLVAPTAHAKNLDIACCVDPRLPLHLMGDPFRLRQVLINLIGNAIKFTAEGEIAIDIIRDHGKVRFEISDTGVGIAPEAQELIFQPFEQASVQVSRQFGGTGLGLSIARQLVQLMGGDLTVESTVNVGSTFRFTIALPASPEAAAAPQTDALADRRILIIENSDASARALSTRLTALGAKIVWVTNMTDGFERLRQGQSGGKPFEAAIAADQAGGLEFLKRIQENPLFSHIRVVIAAPLNRIQSLENLPEMAQTPILTKPLRSDNLDAILHKIRSGRPLKSRAALAQPQTVSIPATTAEAVVLVAEDNPVNAEVASRMLTSAGYRVNLVTNGVEAVAAARQTLYGLILMDGQMPEMDGVDAAKEIRKYYEALPKPCPPPPIIAVTADAFDNARTRYLNDGMDDFIAKPFNRDELLALVARWIRRNVKTSLIQSDYTHPSGKTPAEAAPSAQRTALPVIDRTTLAKVAAVGGEEDPTFLAHIIEIYCRDMSDSLQNMQSALQEQNGDAVRKLAHKMKSSSANLGAVQLATLAARIEKNQIPANVDILRTLQHAYNRVAKELRAVLNGGPA
jgi:signal transduction histidine kinase/CheY-like chemotaxis protein/HPt (histidine-containing phosphotransfer) domain-containing protein